MKNILCILGFHQSDWLKYQVYNMFGDSFVPCKRCDELEMVDGKMTSEGILYECTKKALSDINNFRTKE